MIKISVKKITKINKNVKVIKIMHEKFPKLIGRRTLVTTSKGFDDELRQIVKVIHKDTVEAVSK